MNGSGSNYNFTLMEYTTGIQSIYYCLELNGLSDPKELTTSEEGIGLITRLSY